MSDAPDPTTHTQHDTSPHAAKSGRSISVGQILAGILLVLVVIFIVENNSKVDLRIIAGPKQSVPVWLALFAAAVLGALIAALMRYRRQRKNR